MVRKEVDRLGIRADTGLYLNVVAGSISIFHPSNAALQLTHGLIVAFHVYIYIYTCVCMCVCARSTVRRVGMCLGQYSRRRLFLNG